MHVENLQMSVVLRVESDFRNSKSALGDCTCAPSQ